MILFIIFQFLNSSRKKCFVLISYYEYIIQTKHFQKWRIFLWYLLVKEAYRRLICVLLNITLEFLDINELRLLKLILVLCHHAAFPNSHLVEHFIEHLEFTKEHRSTCFTVKFVVKVEPYLILLQLRIVILKALCNTSIINAIILIDHELSGGVCGAVTYVAHF